LDPSLAIGAELQTRLQALQKSACDAGSSEQGDDKYQTAAEEFDCKELVLAQ
jgi:hypothetical protein